MLQFIVFLELWQSHPKLSEAVQDRLIFFYLYFNSVLASYGPHLVQRVFSDGRTEHERLPLLGDVFVNIKKVSSHPFVI